MHGLVSGLDGTKEPARSSMIGVEPQYLRKMLSGLGELALPGQENAQVIVGHDIAGSELERGGIVADGLGNTALIGQGSPQVMMGFSIVGLETECFHILLDSLLHLPLSIQGIPQAIMRLWIGGLNL